MTLINSDIANRSIRFRLLRWMLLLSLLPSGGCNYFILIGYLIGGPPSIEPDFDKQTNQSMTDSGVTVAVVCYAPMELKWDFYQVDQELAKYVAFRLHAKHVKIINPERIRDWLDKNDDWDNPEEIGEAFDATYVVYIDLHTYSLFEKNSTQLYRGTAQALVKVVKMETDGTGDQIYSKDIVSKYPLKAPKSTSDVTYGQFRRQYLSRLSEEIGRLFYEYYNGDDIPDAI